MEVLQEQIMLCRNRGFDKLAIHVRFDSNSDMTFHDRSAPLFSNYSQVLLITIRSTAHVLKC